MASSGLLKMKIAVADVLISQPVARLIESATCDRIRNNGLSFDVRSSDFTPQVKAMLFWRLYEDTEIRMIRRHLRGANSVVELGSSLGITTRHIAAVVRPGGRILCVEANPRLVEGLRRRLAHIDSRITVDIENMAVASGEGSVEFTVALNSLGSQLASDTGGECVQIRATSLRGLLDKHAVGEFDLVADIEGAEAFFLVDDPGSLDLCRRAVFEMHTTVHRGRQWTADELVDAAVTAGFRVVDRRGVVVALSRSN